MEKTQDQIEKLLSSTIAIDTWVLEHIKFNLNNWKQKVPLGSEPVAIINENSAFDRIDYYRDPTCSGQPIFTIEYWTDGIRVTTDPHRQKGDDRDHSLKLAYDEPDFFERLESWIWNIRTVDYINANLVAIGKNLETFKDAILDDKDLAARRIGYLVGLHEAVGRIDEAVRNLAFRFDNEPAYPVVDGKKIVPDRYLDDDDIPF